MKPFIITKLSQFFYVEAGQQCWTVWFTCHHGFTSIDACTMILLTCVLSSSQYFRVFWVSDNFELLFSDQLAKKNWSGCWSRSWSWHYFSGLIFFFRPATSISYKTNMLPVLIYRICCIQILCFQAFNIVMHFYIEILASFSIYIHGLRASPSIFLTLKNAK